MFSLISVGLRLCQPQPTTVFYECKSWLLVYLHYSLDMLLSTPLADNPSIEARVKREEEVAMARLDEGGHCSWQADRRGADSGGYRE